MSRCAAADFLGVNLRLLQQLMDTQIWLRNCCGKPEPAGGEGKANQWNVIADQSNWEVNKQHVHMNRRKTLNSPIIFTFLTSKQCEVVEHQLAHHALVFSCTRPDKTGRNCSESDSDATLCICKCSYYLKTCLPDSPSSLTEAPAKCFITADCKNACWGVSFYLRGRTPPLANSWTQERSLFFPEINSNAVVNFHQMHYEKKSAGGININNFQWGIWLSYQQCDEIKEIVLVVVIFLYSSLSAVKGSCCVFKLAGLTM